MATGDEERARADRAAESTLEQSQVVQIDLAQWSGWVAAGVRSIEFDAGRHDLSDDRRCRGPAVMGDSLGSVSGHVSAGLCEKAHHPTDLGSPRWPALAMTLAVILGFGLVKPILMPVHWLGFFVAALVCHGELARRRPPPHELTRFYLAMAVGGVLGGVFNALVAPQIFDRVAEYPLAVVLACLALPGVTMGGRTWRQVGSELVIPIVLFLLVAALVADLGHLFDTVIGALGVVVASGLTAALVATSAARRRLRFALSLGALLMASGLATGVDGQVLHRERDFFGVMKITYADGPRTRRLFHGHTLHGEQYVDPALRASRRPTTSRAVRSETFLRRSGRGRPRRTVAVCGLGAGALTCYARPGERWTFYEIDPAVVRIARDARLLHLFEEQSGRDP